ncbi:hypothetical protein HOP50_05g40550 [Chloropicon primus]|uniref:Uncharacterized protein n=1 Tax=Chloropicon primus TaxID=1764295 RepID=A0A5B8MLL4_9CHLO|nr:hypothetical protein A3770_05p40460 [Chloropicon primus]UPR00739.1 hypothetical protein HOP50_05g40550 [Chloropicon primus]|eukprot:QDZ21528.1 hypothetical protein A3770_05p40460 [Chloropicon primus]
MNTKALCIAMALTLGSAPFTAAVSVGDEPMPLDGLARAQISSRTKVWNHGHASAVSANSEQALNIPSYAGSLSNSGSYVQAQPDGAAEAEATSKARTYEFENLDDEGNFILDVSNAVTDTRAYMQNVHHVPYGESETNFLSSSEGNVYPFAASEGRDVFLNSPELSGAYAQAGGEGAKTNSALFHVGQVQFNDVASLFPSQFPLDWTQGRRLLTAEPHYPVYSFSSTQGGSRGSAHGDWAFAYGGNAAASFDSPHGKASEADSVDYVSSGEVEGEANAVSHVQTASSDTKAASNAFAHMNTKWYEPSGTSGSEVTASADGDGGWDVAEGTDLAIVTPHWTGATGTSESGSSYSDYGLQGALYTNSRLVRPFGLTWVQALGRGGD